MARAPWKWIVGVFCISYIAMYGCRFAYLKCDTREQMTKLLITTTSIFQEAKIEYWLDKGTLLGIHRDNGLIPWEYDVDLGVMNETCDKISTLKLEFRQQGLIVYDRTDRIQHKSKLTYDTENHHFYWSDPYLHDPCIRIYDQSDLGTWVDIYWYAKYSAASARSSQRENALLLPPSYDFQDDLICCAEGIAAFTDAMCCGGCVPYTSVFPLERKRVSITAQVKRTEYLPADPARFLAIQYGFASLTEQQIKGWKGIVCDYHIHPIRFIFCLLSIIFTLAYCIHSKRSAKLQLHKSK